MLQPRRSRRLAPPALLALALTLTGTPLGAQDAPAPADSTKAARIRELLDLVDAAGAVLTVLEEAAEQERVASDDVPAEFWDLFLERARANVDDVIERLVPVYDTAFSLEDVNALIAFYRSPTGQRFIERQPAIIRESAAIGQQWGFELGTQVVTELQRRGVKVPR